MMILEQMLMFQVKIYPQEEQIIQILTPTPDIPTPGGEDYPDIPTPSGEEVIPDTPTPTGGDTPQSGDSGKTPDEGKTPSDSKGDKEETKKEEDKPENLLKQIYIQFNPTDNVNDTLPKVNMSLSFKKDTKEYLYSFEKMNSTIVSISQDNCTINTTKIYEKNLTIIVDSVNDNYTYSFENTNSTELKCSTEDKCELKDKVAFHFSCTLYLNKKSKEYLFEMKSTDKVMTYGLTTLEDKKE